MRVQLELEVRSLLLKTAAALARQTRKRLPANEKTAAANEKMADEKTAATLACVRETPEPLHFWQLGRLETHK